MEFKGTTQSNGNRVAQPQTGGQSMAEQRMGITALSDRGPKKGWIICAVIAVVLLVLGAACFMFWKGAAGDGAVMGSRYQAIFLTNGQVYFCKLSNVAQMYVKCTDIYYLQVQQSVQPAEQKEEEGKQPQVSLAKLGSELHAPEDEMQINRDQVLFWENLKDDGKVVQAIKQNKK